MSPLVRSFGNLLNAAERGVTALRDVMGSTARAIAASAWSCVQTDQRGLDGLRRATVQPDPLTDPLFGKGIRPGGGFDAHCAFCRIAAGTGPAEIKSVRPHSIELVPLDPVTAGHRIVIPRKHVANVGIDPEISGAVFAHAAELASAHPNAFVTTSRGGPATQTIEHLHLHVVPMRPDGGLPILWTGQLKTSEVPVMHECGFCARAVAPENIVEQWPDADLISPVNPVTTGHVMVVPHQHGSFSDSAFARSAMEHAAEWASRTPDQSANLVAPFGPDVQNNDHSKIHYVPRHYGDQLPMPWTPQQSGKE